jgi:small-conductance mechanosensitive channel
MQESETSSEDRYEDEKIRYVVEAEYIDSLRGAFLLSIVKIGIAVAMVFFAFAQYGITVLIVGSGLFALVLFPAITHIQRYFFYMSRRDF